MSRKGLAGGARHELDKLPCCVLVLGVRIDRELEPVDGLLIFRFKAGRWRPREILTRALGLDGAIAKEAERRHSDGARAQSVVNLVVAILEAGHRRRLALHKLVLDDLRGTDERFLAEGNRPVVIREVLAVGRGQ